MRGQLRARGMGEERAVREGRCRRSEEKKVRGLQGGGIGGPRRTPLPLPCIYRRFCLLRRPFVTYRSMYVANDNVAEVGSQRFGNAACVLSAMV